MKIFQDKNISKIKAVTMTESTHCLCKYHISANLIVICFLAYHPSLTLFIHSFVH